MEEVEAMMNLGGTTTRKLKRMMSFSLTSEEIQVLVAVVLRENPTSSPVNHVEGE